MDFPTDKQVEVYVERITTDYTILREKLQKERSWKINDSRIVIFTKGIRVLNGVQIGLSHLHRDLKKNTWWKNRFPNDVVTKENRIRLRADFDNFLRNALISEIYGIFESTVRILATTYSPTKFSNRIIFSKIYPNFLQELGLKKFVPLLEIWSNIRNSVHNDGLHRPYKKIDKHITYDEQIYSFYVDKPVFHTGWKDLCELSYELGKATLQIVTSHQISSIGFIEEPGSKYWDHKHKTKSEWESLFGNDS